MGPTLKELIMTTQISPYHPRPSHRPRHPNLNTDKAKARYVDTKEILPDGRSVMESPCDMWPHALVHADDTILVLECISGFLIQLIA